MTPPSSTPAQPPGDALPSPLPWKWADGYSGNLPKHGDDYEADKYLDLALLDADQNPVIPIRVDHWDYELDFAGDKPISDDNRAYIVRACNEYPALLARVEALERDKARLTAALERCVTAIDAGFGKAQRDHIKQQARAAMKGDQ